MVRKAFNVFRCRRRFMTGSLRFRPPTLTSFNKYRKVSNIDQRVKAAEGLAQTKKLPPGLKRSESSTISRCRRHEKLVDGERASGVMQEGAALVTDDPSPSPLKDGELHDQLST
jgi:hypothetical protein